jgi:hypothetical protein
MEKETTSGTRAMTEQDEFEFRHRLEQEQAAPTSGGETTPGMGESAYRGAVQGASLGWGDELGGVGGAIGTMLGGNPKKQSWGDAYRESRDENRARDEAAQKANPKTFMTGEIGGAIGDFPLLPASVPGLIGVGAAAGLGNSNADLTKGQFGQAAKDTAIGAGTAAAIPPVMEKVVAPAVGAAASKINPVADFIAKKLGYGAFKVPEEATEAYLRNPEEIRGMIKNGITPADVAEEVAQAVPDLVQNVQTASGNARNTLQNMPAIPTSALEEKISQIVQKHPYSPDGTPLSQSAEKSAQMLNSWASKIRKFGPQMSEQDLHTVMSGIDQDLDWAASNNLSTTEGDLRQLRGFINQTLGEKNPAYANYMASEVQPLAKGLSAARQNLGVRTENVPNPTGGSTTVYRPTEQTANTIGRIAKGNLNATHAAQNFSQATGMDLGEKAQNLAAAQALQKDSTAGSRLTNLGGFLGMGTGVPGKAAIGASVGAAADRFGTSVFRKMLDMKIGTADVIKRIAASPYGQVLKNAAASGGPEAMATTHYILNQTDPAYQKLLKTAQE